MVNKPVKQSLAAQLLEELERMISIGIWKVGDKLPSEPELMEEFGVGRNTVREAVQTLVHVNVLNARQGDGTYVIAETRLEALMKQKMNKGGTRNIWEARMIIEKQLVRLAALRRTEEDLEAIRKALLIRNNRSESIDYAIKNDVDFHIEIARATHNEFLFELFQPLYTVLAEMIRTYYYKTNYDNQLEMHNKLYESIKEKNPDMAESVMMNLLYSEKELFKNEDAENEILIGEYGRKSHEDSAFA